MWIRCACFTFAHMLCVERNHGRFVKIVNYHHTVVNFSSEFETFTLIYLFHNLVRYS